MNTSTQKIYEEHHSKNRPEKFSILEIERSNLLKKYIGKGKKVLDIGCRDGNLTRYFLEGNMVTGVDIDENALKKANDLGIKTICIDLNGDWNELKGQKFDIVVAGEILEHLYYPEKVVEKVISLIGPEGMFVGSVPNAFSLKNRFRYLLGEKIFTPLEDPTHINQFSYDELVKIFSKYFRDVEIVGLGRYTFLSKYFPSLFAFDLFFVAKNS